MTSSETNVPQNNCRASWQVPCHQAQRSQNFVSFAYEMVIKSLYLSVNPACRQPLDPSVTLAPLFFSLHLDTRPSLLLLTPSRYRQRSVTPRTNLSNDATSVIAIVQLVLDRIPSRPSSSFFTTVSPPRSSSCSSSSRQRSTGDFFQSFLSPLPSLLPCFSSQFSSFPSFPLLRFESMLVPVTVKIMKTTRRVGSSASKRRRKHDSR